MSRSNPALARRKRHAGPATGHAGQSMTNAPPRQTMAAMSRGVIQNVSGNRDVATLRFVAASLKAHRGGARLARKNGRSEGSYDTFGEDYVPLPHVRAAYDYARNYKWYMDARLVTTNDLYSFDPDVQVEIEELTDVIGRNFKQPKEGLGNDNTPVTHMWRTMAIPDAPL
jgi:hypothetical protein